MKGFRTPKSPTKKDQTNTTIHLVDKLNQQTSYLQEYRRMVKRFQISILFVGVIAVLESAALVYYLVKYPLW